MISLSQLNPSPAPDGPLDDQSWSRQHIPNWEMLIGLTKKLRILYY